MSTINCMRFVGRGFRGGMAFLLLWSYALGGQIQEIDVEDASKMIKQPGTVFLDVNTPEEFAEEHIEGARSMPLQALRAYDRWIDLAASLMTPIIVYCTVGVRSSQARAILKTHGFTNTYNLKGGLKRWKQAGLPVVKPASEKPTEKTAP